MDDYSSNTLSDSKNEWSIILMNYLTPHIVDGFRSIFNESVQLCTENDEEEKYLMTFQNLLARIPKWNQSIIDTEKKRIVELCNCSYLEDILTCVHIIQLKILSCVRVGSETKKVSIDIPDFSVFIHQAYTNIARKLYSNIYLFEIDIPPLETQKRNREFELIVQTCIMNTIRDRIPIETLLRQYIDETQEVETTKVEKIVERPVKAEASVKTESIVKPVREEVKVQTLLPDTFDRTETNTNTNSIIDANATTNFNSFNDTITINDPEPRIKFSENNSVLTFDSPIEPISLGETIPIDDFEVLDLSNPQKINIDFEEL
jgi:Family of unknown function (DUF5764)